MSILVIIKPRPLNSDTILTSNITNDTHFLHLSEIAYI